MQKISLECNVETSFKQIIQVYNFDAELEYAEILSTGMEKMSHGVSCQIDKLY